MPHTPGPWRVDSEPHVSLDVIAADGHSVAMMRPSHRIYAELHANANLIAAAPDLLAALKARMECEELCLLNPNNPCGNCINCSATAAIAKAEGQQ